MRRLSITTVNVLQAIASGFEYGFDIIDHTGLPSGTVYPALGRLERDGLVRSSWEDASIAHAEGRPSRRNYRITAHGATALAEATSFYRAMLPARPRPARS
jgi:DNA-binding PadR family transcriptional regulator